MKMKKVTVIKGQRRKIVVFCVCLVHRPWQPPESRTPRVLSRRTPAGSHGKSVGSRSPPESGTSLCHRKSKTLFRPNAVCWYQVAIATLPGRGAGGCCTKRPCPLECANEANVIYSNVKGPHVLLNFHIFISRPGLQRKILAWLIIQKKSSLDLRHI